MPGTYWVLVPTILLLFLVALALVWQPIRTAMRRYRLADVRRDFHWQRERLEVKFLQLAWANAKPGAPRWADCEFDDDVSYVRNRNSGDLCAFVGVTIVLEEEDDVPHLDPLHGYRSGTAIFRFDRSHWETDGRAILNLSPSEAIRLYQDDLEIVGEELIGEH